MDTIFLTFVEQKCCLEQLKLGPRSVKVKVCQNSKVTAACKKAGKARQTDEGGARVPPLTRLPPSAAPALW